LVAQLLITWLVAILASVLIRARGKDGIVMRQLARAHRETEAERRRLQSIFDASSVAIFFVDARGVITQANKRMAEMFGCTVESLQGAEYVSLIHPSEREVGRERMLALLASNIDAVDLERKYWRADHGEFWGHLTGRRHAATEDDAGGLIGVISDITPRRRAEQAQRESEERYRLIAENSSDVIWLMDLASLRFTYVSPSVERLRGWTPEEIMAQPMEAAVTAESALRIRHALVERMQRIAAGDVSARFNVGEADQPCKDGRIVSTEVASTVLLDASGKPAQLLGITRDITERKVAEAELDRHRNHLEELVESRTEDLARALDAAEAASRAKSVFLANMSHELRTPMNGIMGMTSLALRRTSDPKLVEQLDKSMNSARHLLALIDNILDIANFEAGRVELSERRFSLAKLVDELLEMHEPAARAKALGLTAEIAPELPDDLVGDSARLKQMSAQYPRQCREVFRARGHLPAGEPDHRRCRRRGRVFRGQRPGNRPRRRGAWPPVRAVQPGRRGLDAGAWRHRPGPGDRPPHRAPDGRRHRGGQRSRRRQPLPRHGAPAPGLNGMSLRRRAPPRSCP
jgi:PAS domain S-box-containing protein